mgnify:CR=1 FL=1
MRRRQRGEWVKCQMSLLLFSEIIEWLEQKSFLRNLIFRSHTRSIMWCKSSSSSSSLFISDIFEHKKYVKTFKWFKRVQFKSFHIFRNFRVRLSISFFMNHTQLSLWLTLFLAFYLSLYLSSHVYLYDVDFLNFF